MRVAVIGMGVLGAAAARALARQGVEVTVYERQAALAGTSGTSFAWINSHNKNPLPYHELNAAGMRTHAELARERAGLPPWFHQAGNLEWAVDAEGEERLAHSVAELTSRAYRTEWITPDRAREIVPDLRLPDEVRRVAYYPEEGYVIPHLLVARLWGEARDNGAVLRCPEEVLDISETGSGVRLRLASGTADADAVVIATGPWTQAVTERAGWTVPMTATDIAGAAGVGFLGYTKPIPVRVNSVLTTPRLNVRPDGNGSLVLQALDLDAQADPSEASSPDGELARELCARLTHVLDVGRKAALAELRLARRSVPADGLTVAGFVGSSGRVYVLATHSGVTLAPLLGDLAAAELTRGTSEPMLADFRPSRFEGVSVDELPPLQPARFAGQQ